MLWKTIDDRELSRRPVTLLLYLLCKKKKKRKGELKYPISLELLPMCVIVGVSLQPSESSAARENVISFFLPPSFVQI
jgi:hypothetical protein